MPVFFTQLTCTLAPQSSLCLYWLPSTAFAPGSYAENPLNFLFAFLLTLVLPDLRRIDPLVIFIFAKDLITAVRVAGHAVLSCGAFTAINGRAQYIKIAIAAMVSPGSGPDDGASFPTIRESSLS